MAVVAAGESYAGQYIPMLSREVVEGNIRGEQPHINIKVGSVAQLILWPRLTLWHKQAMCCCRQFAGPFLQHVCKVLSYIYTPWLPTMHARLAGQCCTTAYAVLSTAPSHITHGTMLTTCAHLCLAQGYLIGNGVTDDEFDGNAYLPFAAGKSLITELQLQRAKEACNGSFWEIEGGSRWEDGGLHQGRMRGGCLGHGEGLCKHAGSAASWHCSELVMSLRHMVVQHWPRADAHPNVCPISVTVVSGTLCLPSRCEEIQNELWAGMDNVNIYNILEDCHYEPTTGNMPALKVMPATQSATVLAGCCIQSSRAGCG